MTLSIGMGIGITSMGGPSYRSALSILGASLLAQWTADRADLMTLSGAQISSWLDVVSGRNMAQGISGSRPIYSASSFNGVPGVSLDGIDDFMTLASYPFPAGAGEVWLWAVAQQDDPASSNVTRYLVSGGGGSIINELGLRRLVVSGVNRGQAVVGTGATAFGPTNLLKDLSSRHMMSGRIGAASTDVKIDDTAIINNVGVPAITATRTRIGSNTATTPTGFWKGQIRDLLWTSPLSVGKTAELEAYLNARRML